MQKEYIDIHTHGYFEDFDIDREHMMARAEEGGVAMIHVGTGLETSHKAIDLAHTYSKSSYATIGIHPADLEDFDEHVFERMVYDEKVVAIGECGIDYFHKPETEQEQREIFEHHIALAEKTKKPLMLHIRNGRHGEDAYKDTHEILKGRDVIGNVHFFAGSIDDARRFLDLGFTCSFTGVITFAKEYEELVRFVPDDMIHAETDAPYVAPVPERGKRNEPLFVKHIVQKMAEIKKEDLSHMKENLLSNAERLFGV